MSFDFQKFLEEAAKAGNLDANSKKALEQQLSNPGLQDYLRRTTLTQSAWSRQQDQFAQQKKSEWQKVADFRKKLEGFEKEKNAEVEKFQTLANRYRQTILDLQEKAKNEKLTVEEIEAIKLEEAQATQQLRDHLEPKEQVMPQQNANNQQSGQQQNQPDHLTQTFEMFANLNRLAVRHRQMFGEDLLNLEEIAHEAQLADKPFLQYYNERFKVAEKEKELERAQIRAELEKEFQDKLVAIQSQNPLAATGHPLAGESPLVGGLKEAAHAPSAREESLAVDAAVSALLSGTYRGQSS